MATENGPLQGNKSSTLSNNQPSTSNHPPHTHLTHTSHTHTHTLRNLQKDLAAQGNRCTGCGMKVTPSYTKYFRFCNYTGKYFCQNCHMNTTSLVPAHILERWSFKKLPVSNFARDLLAKIHTDAVFTVSNSNAFLYSKVSVMAQAKVCGCVGVWVFMCVGGVPLCHVF